MATDSWLFEQCSAFFRVKNLSHFPYAIRQCEQILAEYKLDEPELLCDLESKFAKWEQWKRKQDAAKNKSGKGKLKHGR